jgi:hypothetical protein
LNLQSAESRLPPWESWLPDIVVLTKSVITINTNMVLDKFDSTMLSFSQLLSKISLSSSSLIVYSVNHIALTRGRLIEQGGEGGEEPD